MPDYVITIRRGELDWSSYNDELNEALETPLAEGKGATFTAYQRFRRACNDLRKAVEDLTESVDPFTVTLVVEGKKKVYPPGPMLYSAGALDGQVEDKQAKTGEGASSSEGRPGSG